MKKHFLSNWTQKMVVFFLHYFISSLLSYLYTTPVANNTANGKLTTVYNLLIYAHYMLQLRGHCVYKY